MGINEGVPSSILPDDVTGRADFMGPFVNMAARFASAAAHGGQIACPEDMARRMLMNWEQLHQGVISGGTSGGYSSSGGIVSGESGAVAEPRLQAVAERATLDVSQVNPHFDNVSYPTHPPQQATHDDAAVAGSSSALDVPGRQSESFSRFRPKVPPASPPRQQPATIGLNSSFSTGQRPHTSAVTVTIGSLPREAQSDSQQPQSSGLSMDRDGSRSIEGDSAVYDTGSPDASSHPQQQKKKGINRSSSYPDESLLAAAAGHQNAQMTPSAQRTSGTSVGSGGATAAGRQLQATPDWRNILDGESVVPNAWLAVAAHDLGEYT